MPCKRSLFLLLILFIGVSLLGQDKSTYITEITQYGVKEGLSHRTVTDVHQDSRGFIWAATRYGLNRFDGKNFQWFTKEKQGLPSNSVHYLHEDADGWLWVFMDNDEELWSDFSVPNKVILINIYSLEVKTVAAHFSKPLPFKIKDVLSVELSADGTSIFMTSKNTFYTYTSKKGFQEVACESLFNFQITDKNTLIGVSAKGYTIQEMNLSGRTIRKQNFPDGFSTKMNLRFFTGIKDAKLDEEYLFYGDFSSSKNVIFKSSQNGEMTFAQLPQNMPEVDVLNYSSNIFYDKRRDWYWHTATEKCFIFNLKKGLIYDFAKVYPRLVKSLIYDVVFTKNITWIATADGLYKVKLTPNPFTSYLQTTKEDYTIHTAYTCRGMLQVGDILYVNVGNGKGTHTINLKTNKVAMAPDLDKPLGKREFPKVIFQENENTIWFSSDALLEKDLKTGSVTGYLPPSAENPPFIHTIWSMYQDKNKKIWLGGEKGFGYVDEQRKLVKHFAIGKPYEMLQEQGVYAFLEVAPDEVLVATTGGVYVFNPLKGKITKRYWTEGKGQNYFPQNIIHHIYRDAEGIFWVATNGGGLIRWERKKTKNTYEQFTIADGLSNNTIYAIYEGKQGNLWMPSDYGIIKFNKITKNAHAYLPEDGVNQYEFNRISHHQAADGRLYFGGLNGVTAFYSEDVIDTSASVNIPLEIVQFSQYSAKTDKLMDKTAELLQTSKILLKPGDQFFDLEFALLNYENTSLIRYAYRISDYHKDWNYINENSIRISGLPYGEYTLTVRGQSPNGQFSANEIVLKIQVIRPIYLRWWFIVLLTAAVIAGIYSWYKWRIYQLQNHKIELENEVQERTEQIQKDKQIIEKQAEELKNLDTLKSNFFANISHELRTPLTLMLAPIDSALKENYLNKRGTTFLQIAKENGKQLLKLINSILDLSKLEANKLDLQPESTAFYPLTRRIIATFESYAQNQGVDLLFNYQAEQTLRLEFDVSKFEMILNNLLSNAIKFTPPKGKVEVIINDNANHIEIIVEDTGRGIHPDDLPYVFNRFYQSNQANTTAEGGTGIGLALVQELVQLFDGSISVESELGKGTTFWVKFPRIEAFDTMNIIHETDTIVEKNEIDFYDEKVSVGIDKVKIKNKKVLLVEDNPTLRIFLKTLLNHHEVTTAGNGQEALRKLGIWNEELRIDTDNPNSIVLTPDLIISDVMMPIMDGFQLLAQLKSDEKYRHIPILMLTARASMGDKLKALRIGVDDYMTKPFEQDELYARVDNLLKNTAERSKWIEEIAPELEAEEILEAEEEALTLTISDSDRTWLESLEAAVQQYVADNRLTTNFLAEEMLLSRSQLFRRLKKLTGLSPSEYIKEYRLKKAYELLENKTYDSVKAVSLSVGITHRTTFNTQFKERFGKLPSEYL